GGQPDANACADRRSRKPHRFGCPDRSGTGTPDRRCRRRDRLCVAGDGGICPFSALLPTDREALATKTGQQDIISDGWAAARAGVGVTVLAAAAAMALAAQCGRDVAPDTIVSIAKAESGFDTFAIHDNTAERSYAPQTLKDAVALATDLIATQHHRVDL